MIKERLQELKEKDISLLADYGNLLKDVMVERGFTELIVLPLDCDGDLMSSTYYEDTVGEWDSDAYDLQNSAISRFAVIDNEICYHTVPYGIEYFDDAKLFSREIQEEPWTPVKECPKPEAVKKCIIECLSVEFPWNFTRMYPGSRIMPFEFDFNQYLEMRKQQVSQKWAFAGLRDIRAMDLTPLADSVHNGIEGMFYGCTALETIDLTGFKLEKDGWALELLGNQIFIDCDSLKTIILRGCDGYTLTCFKYVLSHNPTPLSVTLVTDKGEMHINVKGK